jgi:hypothetical protein
MGMLEANPMMAQNREFMEDLRKSTQVEAQLQEAKKEEEKKPDLEVKYASIIMDLMESTQKPRKEVVNAL